MKKEKSVARKQLTSEERRIKREEDACWREYFEEQKALEAKAQAEIDEAFKQRDLESVDHTADTAPKSRKARRQRRERTETSKERLKRNAADAAASVKARKKVDRQDDTHRDGLKKSRMLKKDQLSKRAGRIKPKEA